MTPEERELRRALAARSGEPSEEFKARLSNRLSQPPRTTAVLPSLAVATAVVLTIAAVGVLSLSRLSHQPARTGAATGARLMSPTPTSTPIYGPTTVQLSAPSAQVVWALVADSRLFVSADGGATWADRSLPSQLGAGTSISFINDREGWLLSPGSAATQCEMQLADLWHTTDGAKTWQDLGARIDKTQCKDGIWFVDSQHGFVTASDANHRPTVFRTEDGGETWAFSTVPDNPLFSTAPGGFTLQANWIKSFGATVYLEASGTQPENTGAQLAFIYTSRDGGATWTWKQKVASAETVMITESRWLQFAPDVEETVNGGQQFHQYATDLAMLSPVLGGMQMTFADATVGYATGRGSLERTLDGGAHWEMIKTPGVSDSNPSPSPVPTPPDVEISTASANVVWALIDSHDLLRSTDGGTTWQVRPLPTSGPVTSISFIDGNVGWVMDGGPAASQCGFGSVTMWHTTDAGATWTTVVSVTDQGSSNGMGFAQCKEHLTFIDSKHGYVTAWDDNGAPTIYRTSDGGVAWLATKLPNPPGFTPLGAGDELRAEPVRHVGSELLVAAYGMQPDGLHSYVFRSLDLGATWAALVSVPAASVAFVSDTRWLLLIMPGKSEETTDSGQHWHPFGSDYRAAGPWSSWIEPVFATAEVGYSEAALDLAGSVALVVTTDGGLHWSGIKPLAGWQSG